MIKIIKYPDGSFHQGSKTNLLFITTTQKITLSPHLHF